MLKCQCGVSVSVCGHHDTSLLFFLVATRHFFSFCKMSTGFFFLQSTESLALDEVPC